MNGAKLSPMARLGLEYAMRTREIVRDAQSSAGILLNRFLVFFFFNRTRNIHSPAIGSEQAAVRHLLIISFHHFFFCVCLAAGHKNSLLGRRQS